MTLVTVANVKLPSGIVGKPNGKLGPCDLTAVHFPGLGDASLAHEVARGYNAMNIAMHADSTLEEFGPFRSFTTTGGGAYRSYQEQYAAFMARFTTDVNKPGVNSQIHRTFKGQTWYYLPGHGAPCAVPGTSNHGYGCALDIAWFDPVHHSKLSIKSQPKIWEWLKVNAGSFGFAWELHEDSVQFEPWHIHWTMGDTIPQRVLDIEAFIAAHQ